jgi:F-type H+-transporting ATPase subunit delta
MIFHGIRWAVVFTGALGGNADAGYEYLKALVPLVKTIPGAVFGYSASRRLEKMLRDSAANAGNVPAGLEYAIRFITMLVEKNHFHNIDSVMRKIEEQLDGQKGILTVTVDTASAMDGVFEEELRRHVMEKTGAAQIKMKTRLVPELLGGYRMRIGGYYIDASLKGQKERMKAELEEAVLAAASAGGGIEHGGL